jgi:hypothetical protein
MNGNHIASGVFDLRARSQVQIDTAGFGRTSAWAG